MWLQLYSIMKQARLITKPGPALVSEAQKVLDHAAFYLCVLKY